MSEDGYKKLMAELKELETVERPKISAAIAEARDKGDLSENAEYDAAKEAQGMLEMKINKLKTIIADAKIIDESKLKTVLADNPNHKSDRIRIIARIIIHLKSYKICVHSPNIPTVNVLNKD